MLWRLLFLVGLAPCYCEAPEGFSRLVQEVEWCEAAWRSSLWVAECDFPLPKNIRPFLVTGIGRSGTEYLTKLMSEAGMDVSHEEYFLHCPCPGNDGAVSWGHAFSSDAFFLNKSRSCPHVWWQFQRGRRLKKIVPPDRTQLSTRFREVMHLVRDPLKNVNSRYNAGKIHAFAEVHSCNVDTSAVRKNPLAMTLHHWVHWNLFIEATASRRVRIEDFDQDEGHLAQSLCANLTAGYTNNNWYEPTACPSAEDFKVAALKLPTNDHTGHTKKAIGGVTWSALHAQDPDTTRLAQLMALRYGYAIDPKDLYVDPAKHKESCTFRKDDGRWLCRLVTIIRGGSTRTTPATKIHNIAAAETTTTAAMPLLEEEEEQKEKLHQHHHHHHHHS